MVEQESNTSQRSEIMIAHGESIVLCTHMIHIQQGLPGRDVPIEPNTYSPEAVASYLQELDRRVNTRTIVGLTVHSFDWNTLIQMQEKLDGLKLNKVQIIYCVEAYSIRNEEDNNIWSIRDHLGQHIVLVMPGKPSEIFQLLNNYGLNAVENPTDPNYRAMTRFRYIKELRRLGFYSICAHPTDRLFPFLDSYLIRELEELKASEVIDAIELNIDRIMWFMGTKHDGDEYIRNINIVASKLGLPLLVGTDAHGPWHLLERNGGSQDTLQSDEWNPRLAPFVGFNIVQNNSDKPLSLIDVLRDPIASIVPNFSIPRDASERSIFGLFKLERWEQGGISWLVIKALLMAYLDEMIYRKYNA